MGEGRAPACSLGPDARDGKLRARPPVGANRRSQPNRSLNSVSTARSVVLDFVFPDAND